MNIFEIASRKKFRFSSTFGDITTEQLWELPLTAKAGHGDFDLDKVARAVNTELRAVTEESFVQVNPDPRKGDLEVKLEIVKHIIASKIEEQERAKDRAARHEKRKKLLEALAEQENKELASKSKDEILKELEELDAA